MQRNLYQEWKDALDAAEFDVAKLQEIHTLWQAKKQREAEWADLWEQCSDEWKAELVEAQVRMELGNLSKSTILERARKRFGWERCSPNDFTKEQLLHWFIEDAQRNVRGTQARTQEKWKQLHGSPTGQTVEVKP